MKQFVVAALVAGLIGTLAILPRSDVGAAEKSPFVGNWMAVDNDGSNLQLSIHGGPRPTSLKISDDWASSCPSGGAASGIGKAMLVDADTLNVVFRVRCHSDKSKRTVARTFHYVLVDDTLVDDTGVTWHRS